MATDPQAVAQKWSRNLQSATQDITDGVNAVQTAPGAKAAAQKQAWLQKVTASQDKWARNVGRVTLDEWKSKMTQVGIPRIAQGAAANVDKVAGFMGEFLPYVERGAAQVRSMPNVTIEDGINRAIAMIRHNAGFKRGAS